MSETCPVLRIKHENPAYGGEFVEINASDYDPKKHQLYAPEADAKPASSRKPKSTEKE
jgi:hypothetical protein